MGKVRADEMQEVAKVLDLSGMTILDLPDSGLKDMDPREIESVIRDEIVRIDPEVVVTYAVHGISGFHDHLVSHAVVKRVFVELREELPALSRLAFLTVTEEQAEAQKHFRLSGSKPEEIDCYVEVEKDDIEKARRCLDCYVTFKETIEKTGIKDQLPMKVPFEFFQESFDPPVTDLFESMPH
jgi:LmbE family N-acetylglucosaminyl deacetylase